MNDRPAIQVALFARNEAANIARSIQRLIDDAADVHALRICVLVNGCTDNTADVVRRCAQEHPQVQFVELPIGDKCNAWNHYVHHMADPAIPYHFFGDGDVCAGPGSIVGMVEQLGEQPEAWACAGLPLSGRNRVAMAELVRQRRWIFGNLYCVRFEHLQRVRDAGVRLPLGLCGNDHMITRIVKTGVPDVADFDDRRVTWREGCGYQFTPLSPWSIRDVRIARARQITYALRYEQLLRVGEAPLDALPSTMDAINREILSSLRLRRLSPWSPRYAVRQRLERWYGHEGGRFEPMLAKAA